VTTARRPPTPRARARLEALGQAARAVGRVYDVGVILSAAATRRDDAENFMGEYFGTSGASGRPDGGRRAAATLRRGGVRASNETISKCAARAACTHLEMPIVPGIAAARDGLGP
jgi:hypothetical protein